MFWSMSHLKMFSCVFNQKRVKIEKQAARPSDSRLAPVILNLILLDQRKAPNYTPSDI